MARSLWILNGTVVTQNESRAILKRGHIRVENGVITEIKKSAPSKKQTAKSKLIHAHGRVILPGFVQAHVHLCQTLFRNRADDLELMDWLKKRIWKFEAGHTEKSLDLSARIGIRELLSSGTTCILDMATVKHTEVIFEAARDLGIRANIGKCLMDHPETTPQNLREPMGPALREATRLFEKWNGSENDRIRVSYAPRFVISCTERLLRGVREQAHAHRAIVHTHASENLREISIVKELTHAENIEYLHALKLTSPRTVLAHCIWLKPGEKEILKRTGTHVVHCPSSNMKLASGFADVVGLRSRGINVALGADGAPCNNNLDMFREMRLAALIHKPARGPRAMRAQEVLDMATRSGAKALQWWDQIGSIEVGKKADLVSLNLNTLENGFLDPSTLSQSDLVTQLPAAIVYSASRANVEWTMVDGKRVWKT